MCELCENRAQIHAKKNTQPNDIICGEEEKNIFAGSSPVYILLCCHEQLVSLFEAESEEYGMPIFLHHKVHSTLVHTALDLLYIA